MEPPFDFTVGYDSERRQLVVGHRRLPVVNAHMNDITGTVEFRERRVIVGFENRWQLSIVWGGATYSDNHDWMGPMRGWRDTESQPFTERPHTVEIGVLLPEPITYPPPMTPESVEVLNDYSPGFRALDKSWMLEPRTSALWGDPLAYVGTNHLLALLDVMPRLPSHPNPAALADPDFDDVESFITTVRSRFGLDI